MDLRAAMDRQAIQLKLSTGRSSRVAIVEMKGENCTIGFDWILQKEKGGSFSHFSCHVFFLI